MDDNRDISRLKIEKNNANARRGRSIYFYVAGLAAVILPIAWYVTVYFSSVSVRSAVVTMTYPSQGLTLLNASGYVVAQRKASLASRTTGRLVWLGVEEGSRVARGQVVARIEGQDAEAAVDEAVARKGVSIKGLEQAKAELDDASRSLDRNKALYSAGFISMSDFDSSEARFKKASASFEGAKAQVKVSEASLKAAEAALGYTEIRSPFDGVVLTKNADIGDILTPLGASVTSKSAVVTVADLSSLQVEVDVSESNINLIRREMPCEIQLDAIPEKRFPCGVHMIVPTVDRTKAAVLVKVRFLEPPGTVLPEMSARVAFLERKLKDDENAPRPAISPRAIVKEGSDSYIFIIKDGRAEKRRVVTGEKLADSIEIVSGAQTGERVVLSPPDSLRSGARLKLIEE